jgi:hypothetical protein
MSATRRNIAWFTVFAIAMAHVEAALVVYLRSLYYPADPMAIFPLSMLSQRDLAVEIPRELATIVMICCVALLGARGFVRRFAAFLYVFGVWDIFYYAWLKTMIGWPVSWLEWDVLFLIPWPWFAPWISAPLMALLFVFWGAWILWSAADARLTRASATLFLLGTSSVLLTFLWPAALLLPGGERAFEGFQPDAFPWPLYLVGYLLTAAGLWRATPPR